MSEEMRLIIVSGLSGSGKSIALHVLEDLGYYCVDNLPAALLKSAVDEITSDAGPHGKLLAVAIDARNRQRDLQALPRLIQEFREQKIHTDVLFLQASDNILLQRYAETRRRHPLAEHGTALRAAIAKEREILSEVINSADLIIDTSRTSIYELADVIRERVDRRSSCLPNPYWTVELRGLTGLDTEVTTFLDNQESFVAMHADILAFLERWIPEYRTAHRSFLTVAIGCTGGQHRSVYMTEKLATSLRAQHELVLARHNELGNRRVSKS